MTMTVKEIVGEIKEKLERAGGLRQVCFVACGGSKAAIFPGLYLLQSEARTFGATTYTSNEFVHAAPKELDSRCLAVRMAFPRSFSPRLTFTGPSSRRKRRISPAILGTA